MKIALASKPLLAALLVLYFGSSNAQHITPEFELRSAVQRNIPSLKKQISRYQIVNFPASKITDFVNNNKGGRFRLRLSTDEVMDIVLEPSVIASKNYRLKILTPAGTQAVNSRPDYLYRGKVLGEHGGEVRLTIKNGIVKGYITTDEKEFNIAPLSRYLENSSGEEYIIYDKRDVIAKTDSPYDIQVDSSIYTSQNKRSNYDERELSGQCKKVRVLQVTDYQMFQQFNYNIDSLETFLFTNMNEVQGVYHGFNFSPDSTTDVGEDSIQFEIFETIISTCSNCDILTQGNNSTELNGLMRTWAKNYQEPNEFLSQFWSPRRLFSQTLEAVGISNGLYCDRSVQLLRYYTDNPVALRFLTAHETGHNLGCIHDNDVKRDVNQFFMNSYFVPTATRFSRLSDFGGALLAGNLYSSQLTFRSYVLSGGQCFSGGCNDLTTCNIVDGLTVTTYESDDSAKVSWNGLGRFKVILKEKDFYAESTVDSLVADDNYIVFKNLNPCTTYQVIVSRICDSANASPPISFIFLNGPIEILNFTFSNLRFSKYDLQLNVKHTLKSNTSFYIFVDHKPFEFYSSNSQQLISIKDLFSDGARHRIDIRKELTNQSCTKTYYYHAPYFREKASLILKNDFNDSCNFGAWNDSVLLTLSFPTNDPFTVSEATKNSLVIVPGSIDSSCFVYSSSMVYNSSNLPKTFSLMSPSVDIRRYSNVMLSFDYNYWTMYWRDTTLSSYLKAEAYDGSHWQEVFKQKEVLYFHNINLNKPIFDTLPPRVFISLDSFRNSNFQLRFVCDNGMVQPNVTPWYLVALDNIRVDGYLSSADVSKLKYKIYPNPTHDEIVLVFDHPVVTNLSYQIFDILGRTVDKGMISNDRIKLKILTTGTYMLQVFRDGSLVDQTKKIIRN